MNTHVDKAQEHKNKTITHESVQLQGLDEPSMQLFDARPEAIAQRKLQALMKDNSQAAQLKSLQAIANNCSHTQQAAQLQAMANNHAARLSQHPQPIQMKENKTGLPDNLKSGMESLSGMSLDHVKVHYNSPKPATVQAHAYAQGSEIHLAGGQEKHLPHELGHVVQQMQGRVQPTTTVGGMQVNDNPGLENEATAMGEGALQRVEDRAQNAKPVPISRKDCEALFGNTDTIAASQIPIQRVIPASKADALLLTQGTTRNGGIGRRQGKNHGGHALKAQLKAAGELEATVDAMAFREYDVNNETAAGRDDERVIHCSANGRIWYTNDHYVTHQEIV